MKKYTKEIAAVATMALFAPWANAQVDVYNANPQGAQMPADVLLVDGQAQVADTFVVAPVSNPAPTTNVQPPAGGIDPMTDPNNGVPTTTDVVTVIGEGTVTSSEVTGGGVTLETNGNGTFEASEVTDSEGDFLVYTEFEVYNADQPDAGLPVPGTQTWYVELPNGTSVATFATQADLDTWLADDNQILADVDAAGGITDTVVPGVGGDVDIDGNLELGDISDVEAAINGNSSDITVNSTNISTNASDIDVNELAISTNASDIDVNESGISTNASDIDVNELAISTNASDIDVNESGISTNASDIDVNSTNISTNSTNIGVNSTNIANEVSDRSELIRKAGTNADGNTIVEIGPNSLFTEELDGQQLIYAKDASDNAIPVRFSGEEGVIVDNYIHVTAPDADAAFSTNSSGAGSELPTTEAGTPTTTPVVTVLGTTAGSEVDGASGGVLIESNGDVTLSQGGGTETSVEFLQVVTFDVNNPGEPNEGLPVAGSERYVAGFENAGGNFQALSPEFMTQAELDNWIATTDLNDAAYDPVRESQTLAGSGGNLQVGGDANIDGILTVGGLQSSYNPQGDIVTEFGAVNSAIAGNTAAIASNSVRIDKNERDIDENRRGIAMVAALQHTTVLPGMTNALDVAAAHFEGETGLSLNYSRRINENWQINFGAASTTDFDESVVKVGAGVQW